MKTILIDDEKMSLEVLEHMLKGFEDVNIIGKYTSLEDALLNLRTLDPEVVFLDIELGAINGLEASQIILAECSKANIVFITAYSEYAVDAFELNAVDYLLKPVQIIRLSITLERIRININENSESEYESNSLKINCFGDFEVKNQNNQSISWRTKKSKEIFV